jgi:hypothetical protein
MARFNNYEEYETYYEDLKDSEFRKGSKKRNKKNIDKRKEHRKTRRRQKESFLD